MSTPTGVLFQNPIVKPLSSNGAFMSGCTATFYLTGTTTPATIYADGALTTPLANPLTADSSGTFVAVYLNPATIYRVQIKTSTGVLISDTDPYIPSSINNLTQTLIGQTLYPQTPAEVTASVTPTNYAYPPGDLRRYGAKLDGATVDTDAWQAAISCNLTVYFPPGTSVISPTAKSGTTQGVYLGTQNGQASRNGLTIYGAGASSILKLGNAVGASFSIFGAGVGDSLTGITFHDFNVDLNGSNNLQVNFTDPLRYNSLAYLFCQCSQITFRNIYAKNGSGSQWIRVGDDTAAHYGFDILIEDCIFDTFGIGLSGNHQQDVSVLYLEADRIRVVNCSFLNPAFTFDLSRGHTAIELHGVNSTQVLGCKFVYTQTPVLHSSDFVASDNCVIDACTFYQCNYMVNWDNGLGFNQLRTVVSNNVYFSTVVSSVICPIGAVGEASIDREDIQFVGNVVNCFGNSNQGTPLFTVNSTYLRSINIADNIVNGLNGSLIYVSGTVQFTGTMDITITGNRMDSLGATSGSFPNSPVFVHIETSAGTVNAVNIKDNTMFNSSTKNYGIAGFGCYRLVGNINYISVRNNTRELGNLTYLELSDLITNPVYKDTDCYGEVHPSLVSAPTTLNAASNVIAIGGAGTIQTIVPQGRSQVILLPATGATWTTTNSGGNIAFASTAVVGKALAMTYDQATAKWYPSY